MSSLAKAHYKSPSPPSSVRSTSNSFPSGSSPSPSEPENSITDDQGQPFSEASVGVVIPRVEKREYMAECRHDNGVLYSVGDIVHLMPIPTRLVFYNVHVHVQQLYGSGAIITEIWLDKPVGL